MTRRKTLAGIPAPTAESLERVTGISRNSAPKGKLESVGSKGWGGETKQTVTPSGVKLILDEDEECILRFVGEKDISDVMGKEPGSVIYNTFWDGKRLVSIPCGYATKKAMFTEGTWYYIWVAALIPNRNPSFNSMKDFEIRQLGLEGEKVQCPEKICDDRVLNLNEDVIAVINYTRLNYPLR